MRIEPVDIRQPKIRIDGRLFRPACRGRPTGPHGGSVPLGHPFGATGARIVSQAVKELAALPKGSRAIVSICADGGQGSVGNWIKDPLVKNRDDLIRWIGFGQTREYLERVGLNYQVYQTLYENAAPNP